MKVHRSFTIGVDVGGTTTRCGLLDDHSRLVDARRTSTSQLGSVPVLLDWIAGARHEWVRNSVINESNTTAIGLALPGLLDDDRRSVRRSVNIPWLEGMPLTSEIGRALGTTARLFTDAESATWGEYAAMTNAPRDFVHLRIGTGVALGVIKNGQLVDLCRGRHGHLEELIVAHGDSAPPCACGLRGCLEAVLRSRMNLPHLFCEHEGGPETDDSSGTGARLNASAIRMEEIIAAIMIALQQVCARWQPGVIVLGGGVIESQPALLDRLLNHWNAQRTYERLNPLPLQLSQHGDDAGMVGAGLLAHLEPG